MNTQLLDDLGRIFDWQPDPTRYVPTPATETLRQGLRHSLESGHGVTALTGSAGAGKTLLLQITLQDLHGRWAHRAQLAYTAMSGAEILRSVAYAFGMPASHAEASAPAAWVTSRLRHWASLGEASLLVVDEAHNLPVDALHGLLALSQPQADGRPLLQILLVGRPALRGMLAAPSLRAWESTVGTPFALAAFQAGESAAYIADRLGQLQEPGRLAFSAPVLAEIHARTPGRPGEINLLCKQLLQTAVLLEDSAAIDIAAVAAEADELGFHARQEPGEAAPNLALLAAPVAPRAVAFDAAPDNGPVAPATIAAEAPRVRRTSWVVPALALLLVAAVGAGVFLQRSGAPAPARAPVAIAVPPLPELKAQPASTAPTVPANLPQRAEQASPPQPAPLQARHGQPARLATSAEAATRHAFAAKPAAPLPLPLTGGLQPCAQLLAQLSLGEPLSARQQHTLESTCR